MRFFFFSATLFHSSSKGAINKVQEASTPVPDLSPLLRSEATTFAINYRTQELQGREGEMWGL